MTIDELNEADAVVVDMMTALRAACPGTVGRPGSVFRYAVGDLLVSAKTYIKAGALGTPLLNCFEQARLAGALLTGVDAVRKVLEAETPVGIPAIVVTTLGIRYSLLTQSKILAATTFTSSDDARAALAAIIDPFESAQEFASDNHSPACSQALIALQASVVNDLMKRAAQLPRLVTYSLARSMTSHALANYLYGDANRCDELRAENQTIHPAFMPATGTALSE